MAAIYSSMTPIPYRIVERVQDTADVFTLELQPENGVTISPYDPGQFNMLYVFGVGEIPISISGDPQQRDSALIHTTRAVGTVTKAMAGLKEGSTIGVRGPFGSAWPVEEAIGKDVVLVAGGIGLAPVRPAIYQIIRNRAAYGKVVILYGARTPEDLLFQEELVSWRNHYDIELHVTVDNATGRWLGNVGFVTQLVRRAPFDPHDVVAMICGPEIMMRFTVQELNKRGVSDQDIYITMERNMKCGIGFCGHCQFGPEFICKDGPVFPFSYIRKFFDIREL